MLHYTILFYSILIPSCKNTIQYHTILYYTILDYTILYSGISGIVQVRLHGRCPPHTLHYTILHYTTTYYAILYFALLFSTLLYFAILYYTILYYTTSLSAGFAGCSPGRLPGTQRPKTKGSPLWLQAAAGLLPWGATPRGAAQP